MSRYHGEHRCRVAPYSCERFRSRRHDDLSDRHHTTQMAVNAIQRNWRV